MKYKEAEEYIQKISAYGSVLGLDTIRELLKRMGNPQDTLSFVHIAGTNGKGSVLAYVSTILKEAGYRVGRYLSPVISDYREKIQVGGRMISQKALCEGLELVKDHAEQMEAEGWQPPTLFETETALAFWFFAKKKCDIVILETGMGGIEDATNIIRNTKVAVFTPISYDHIGILGDTLTEIAEKKAGIIKEGAVVVSAVQKPEVMEVLQRTCQEKGCVLRVTEQPQKVKYGIFGQRFSFHKNVYKIRLAGMWQPENACVALEVIEVLREQGISIKEEAVRRGLEETVWDGRFTVLRKKPLLIMDGAHNEDAVKRLRESLEGYFPGQRFLFIMGVLRDKEYDKMLEIMAPLAQYIITITPPENPRALSAFDLADKAKAYHPCVTAADSLEEAVEMAGLLAGEEYVTIAFGSLSYLGRLRKILERCK
ncbi:MAG: bifunctional folylpolyglutamate synthase/dihydrofolate synthase [Lachnospiraceae bacterium]|nr:bifunctional folylpolyglutamate synthase/dihydrofolate synthase [Lachnospiraceae bacterium]